jgi:hypothetical protein
MEFQWRRLILEPAQNLKDDIVGPILIIIDALDECGTSRSRREILVFLTKHSSHLPVNFRIVVTSRPEQDIMRAVKENVQLVEVLDLQRQQDQARQDVDLYIHDRLKQEAEEFGGQLNDLAYSKLSMMADGLFQWAFTACKFMLDDLGGGLTLRERFEKLCSLNPSGLKGLDELYSSILRDKFRARNSEAMARFHTVMAEVLGAAEPLSFHSIHSIHHNTSDTLPEHLRCCDESTNVIKLVLKEMGSLLVGALEDETPIRPFHTSFRDFLTNENRSKEWYINVDLVNPLMTLGCFRIMNSLLHFNICELSSSFLSNDKMIPVDEDQHISLSLKYACQFWGFHLQTLQNVWDVRLYQEVTHFTQQNMLFWLEALSVLQWINRAGPALTTLGEVLKNTKVND